MGERVYDAATALEFGSIEEASVVFERLFSVTQATYERTAQLQRALESRIVIEQAKGVLAERFKLGLEEAFALLRGAARAKRIRVRDLARDVVAGGETPAPIVAQLARTR